MTSGWKIRLICQSTRWASIPNLMIGCQAMPNCPAVSGGFPRQWTGVSKAGKETNKMADPHFSKFVIAMATPDRRCSNKHFQAK